jgi:hypothetical protein
MTPIGEVPIGAIVFLSCGCSGHRLGMAHGRVIVVVEGGCPDHPLSVAHTVSLEPWELVSPFRREEGIK